MNTQQQQAPKKSRLIRLPEVKTRVGICKTGIYARMNAGTFPKKVKLGPRSVAWIESDIDDWISNRVKQAYSDSDNQAATEAA